MVLGEEIGKLFSHMLYLRQCLNTQAVIHFGVSLSLARTMGTTSQLSQTPECLGQGCLCSWLDLQGRKLGLWQPGPPAPTGVSVSGEHMDLILKTFPLISNVSLNSCIFISSQKST